MLVITTQGGCVTVSYYANITILHLVTSITGVRNSLWEFMLLDMEIVFKIH